MKLVLIVCGLIVVTVADIYSDTLISEWNTFKLEYDKNYSDSLEDVNRMITFMKNRRMIAKHNQLYALGLSTFKLGINEYADMPFDEFINHYNGLELSIEDIKNISLFSTSFIRPENIKLPNTVDWRTDGAVTPVKNQGPCGSCWAFSTVGSLEGQNFRSTKVLTRLSEQNLIDCSQKYGNHGCNGGNMVKAFDYIIHSGGIDTEKSYPYTGKDTGTCRFNRDTVGGRATGYVIIPTGNEAALKEAVATVGPVSVAIDASHDSFMLYSSGYYYEPACSPNNLDHAVLIVGYGTESDGQDYWLVKNSWGTSWGMNGYIKMARNRKNNCGIASFAVYPLV